MSHNMNTYDGAKQMEGLFDNKSCNQTNAACISDKRKWQLYHRAFRNYWVDDTYTQLMIMRAKSPK